MNVRALRADKDVGAERLRRWPRSSAASGHDPQRDITLGGITRPATPS